MYQNSQFLLLRVQIQLVLFTSTIDDIQCVYFLKDMTLTSDQELSDFNCWCQEGLKEGPKVPQGGPQDF